MTKTRLPALVAAMERAWSVLLLLLLLCPHALATKNGANEPYTASSNKMFLHLLDLDTYPQAVCNDGSPGGFFFTPATSPAKAHLWVLFLEGGQWCYDAPSCYQRAQAQPFLISSQRWPPHQRFSGIFAKNPRRNPFAGANLVYLSYCSSDAWVGDAGPESNPMGWSASQLTFSLWGPPTDCPLPLPSPRPDFRGQKIIEATVSTLLGNYSIGEGTRLLFGGCSAGARGALFTLDSMSAMLPKGVELRGFLDSPLWVDVEPLNKGTMPLQNETQAVVALMNVTARLGATCLAAYPAPEDQWKCLYGQYRLPFVATPYLLSASQFDKYQLPYNEGANPPYTGPALAYADQFQEVVRGVVLNLPTRQQPNSAVYSSACFRHCTSVIGSFWGVRINGLSLKNYLADWYFGSDVPAYDVQSGAVGNAPPESLPVSISAQRIESCTGFNCGQCHARHLAAPQPPLPPAYTVPSPPPGGRSKAHVLQGMGTLHTRTAGSHAGRAASRLSMLGLHIAMAFALVVVVALVWQRLQGPAASSGRAPGVELQRASAERAPLVPRYIPRPPAPPKPPLRPAGQD